MEKKNFLPSEFFLDKVNFRKLPYNFVFSTGGSAGLVVVHEHKCDSQSQVNGLWLVMGRNPGRYPPAHRIEIWPIRMQI